MPDIAGRPIAVVCHRLNNHRHPGWSVPFIINLFQIGTVFTTGATLDGTLDIIIRHINTTCILNGKTQAEVAFRIAAAFAGSNNYLARDSGKSLSFGGVALFFAMLNVSPLGMT